MRVGQMRSTQELASNSFESAQTIGILVRVFHCLELSSLRLLRDFLGCNHASTMRMTPTGLAAGSRSRDHSWMRPAHTLAFAATTRKHSKPFTIFAEFPESSRRPA